jgi:hypothetical protein
MRLDQGLRQAGGIGKPWLTIAARVDSKMRRLHQPGREPDMVALGASVDDLTEELKELRGTQDRVRDPPDKRAHINPGGRGGRGFRPRPPGSRSA